MYNPILTMASSQASPLTLSEMALCSCMAAGLLKQLAGGPSHAPGTPRCYAGAGRVAAGSLLTDQGREQARQGGGRGRRGRKGGGGSSSSTQASYHHFLSPTYLLPLLRLMQAK